MRYVECVCIGNVKLTQASETKGTNSQSARYRGTFYFRPVGKSLRGNARHKGVSRQRVEPFERGLQVCLLLTRSLVRALLYPLREIIKIPNRGSAHC